MLALRVADWVVFVGSRMMYQAYQAYADMMAPLQAAASAAAASSAAWPALLSGNSLARRASAFHEWLALARLPHQRPSFGLDPGHVCPPALAASPKGVPPPPFFSP